MPVIGGYSTTRELHRTGLGCVFVAVRSDGADGFVIKTCQPDVLVIGGDAAAAEIAEFLTRVETAKAVAQHPSCGSRWATVHASGRIGAEQGGGAYCVCDLASVATVDKLIAGRVALDGPTLAWLVGEIVEALRELDTHLQRGHGNLKPTNVLVRGDLERELNASKVILCDPAVLSPNATDSDRTATRRADLRALGVIIHGLVLHARFTGGWPLEAGPAWSALGADGNKWRELVNALLDPSPQAQPPTLEQIAARVAPMRLRKASRRPVWLGVAAALLLAGGATTAYVLHARHAEKITIVKWREAPEQHAAKWRELCGAYRGWYSLFQAGLGQAPTMGLKERGYRTRREAYDVDPQLRELVHLPGIAEGYDPWSIAHVAHDTDLSPLANAPTDHARSDAGIEKTEQALTAVDALKKGLVEGWNAPQRLREKAAVYKDHGWTNAARALEDAAADVNPDKAPDPCAAVDSVVSLVDVTKKIDAAWGQIEKTLAGLASHADPVLKRVSGSGAQLVGAGLGTQGVGAAKRDDLLSLEKQATDTAALTDRLAKFVTDEWARVDTESFGASPEYAAARDGSLSPGAVDTWMEAATHHRLLDPSTDPRRQIDLAGAARSLEQKGATLVGKPLKGTVEPALAERLSKAKRDAEAIAPEKVLWKRSNKDRVETETTRLKAEIDRLGADLDRLIGERRAFVAAEAAKTKHALETKNEVVQSAPAINAAWKTWRDAAVAGFKDDAYEETAAKARTVEAALAGLDKAFPAPESKVDGLPETDWSAALAEAARAEREKRVATFLKANADVTADGFAPAASRAGSDYGDWLARVSQMRRELGRAEEAANTGDDSGAIDALEKTVERWTADPIGKQAEIAQAIGSIRERVAATKAVKSETNPGALMQRILNPGDAKPELALAAWRRLGDADVGWPRTSDDLAQGAQVRSQLATIIRKLPEARRAPLARQVSADLAARWARYAEGVRDPRVLEQAFDAMPTFSVDEGAEARLEPRLRYNLLLARLRKGVKPASSDEEVVASLGAFMSGVRALGSSVTGASNVSRLLSDADPIARGEEIVRPKVDPRTLGPARMGGGGGGGRWQANLDPTTAELTFTRGSTTLLFVRVPVPSGGPDAAVYLSTRELSIGDAADILDAGNGAAEFKKDLPTNLNAWVGPRGWRLDGRGLPTPQNWILIDSNMTVQLPGYAPEINDSGQIARVAPTAGGEPTRDTPLQAIPPATLAYIARLVGCRFPTSAEWQAAHALFDGGAEAPGANLRDQTFEKQRAHVAAARQSPGLTRQDAFAWPDAGAFTPETGAKAPQGKDARSRAGSDGVLWFAPTSVGGGAKVHHLVGNVAELVIEDGPVMERMGATDVAKHLFDATPEVIGGSALSAPEIPIDKPQPLDDVLEGYTDVGCRLAFNAAGTAPPRESFATRLSKLLTDDAYLLPAR